MSETDGGEDMGWDKYHPEYVIADKYQLESVLGEGGMGAVWLARNLTLDTHVAIKLVRSDLTHPSVAERLMIEAKAAARLDHPAIVRVYDFGKTRDGDPYIVMEVVRGEELNDVLDRKGSLPAGTAVSLLLPIASALSAAHARGIVHRDVKPENIILMTGDEGLVVPKLVDFGVAHVQTKEKRRLTTQGQVVGTPNYMAPEQAMARPDADERMDVWAFCVVLYETIAGRMPFEGDTHAEMMTAILRDDPRPTTDFGAGDDKLWQFIERGLSKSPAKRWKSMRALGSVLAGWAVSHGIETDAAGTSLTRQWLNEGVPRMLSEPPLRSTSRGANVTPPPVPSVQSPPPDTHASPAPSETMTPRWARVIAAAAAVAALVGAGVAVGRLSSGTTIKGDQPDPAMPATATAPPPETARPATEVSALEPPSSSITSGPTASASVPTKVRQPPPQKPVVKSVPAPARSQPPRGSRRPGLKPITF